MACRTGIWYQRGSTILGAGPIGLAILLVLKTWGVRVVIASEMLERWRELARKFGAGYLVNPLEREDGVDPVIANGYLRRGADVAYEATGLQATLEKAIVCVKLSETMVNVSIHEKPLTIDEDIVAVMGALASGLLVADEMITSIIPLEDAVMKELDELADHREKHVKILIHPNQS